MTLKERFSGVVNVLRSAVLGEDAPEENQTEANLANGGHSGYRPSRTKGRDIFSTHSMEPVTQGTGYTGAVQSQAEMYTGQAQVTPPATQTQEGTAYNGFQNPPAWSAQPEGNAATYQQPAPNPVTGMYQQPGYGYETGYQPQMSQQAPMLYQNQQNPPQTQDRRGRRNQEPQAQPVPNNVTLFPGTFVDQNGVAYVHVERIAQLLSVSACFRIIEFMRNGESVIVNTESIASDTDVQRCLDMLSGAAFTLGCTLTKITQVKRAYLIAPSNVMVMEDTAMSRWAESERTPEAAAPAADGAGRMSRRRAYAQGFGDETAYARN